MKARFCCFVLMLGIVINASQAQLHIIDIGLPDNGVYTKGYAVNDAKQVTGRAHLTNVPAWGEERNFIWSPTAGLQLISSWGPNTNIGSINASGTVCGNHYDGSWNYRAGTYDISSGWIDFPFSDPSLAYNYICYGINDQNLVVGQASSANGSGGFIYDPLQDDITSLGLAANTVATSARAINNKNIIVGTGTLSNGGPTAVSYVNGNWNNLGTLGGWWAASYDVSDYNVMVGIGSWSNGYAMGMLRNLDTNDVTQTLFQGRGYNWGVAYGINDSGVVVGAVSDTNYWQTPDGWNYITGMKMDGRAVIWDSVNDTRFLDDLVPDDYNEWTLSAATGINNNGDITGWGLRNGQTHAFLIVNEPIADGDVLLYHNFRNELTPNFTNGNWNALAQSGVGFTAQGRRAKGLYVGSNEKGMAFLHTGNIDLARGTVAFWYKAGFDADGPFPRGKSMFQHVRAGYGYTDGGQISINCDYSDEILLSTAHVYNGQYMQKSHLLMMASELGDNQWHHFVIKWDSDSDQHYFTVVFDGSTIVQDWNVPPIERWGPDYAVTLGGVPDVAGYGFDGTYDDWIIFKRPLTGAETQSLYNGDYNWFLDLLEPNPYSASDDIKIEMGLVDQTDSIYTYGQNVHVDYSIIPEVANLNEISVILQLKDYYGTIVSQQTQTKQSNGIGVTISDDANFAPNKLGIFKVHLICKVGEVIKSQKDITSFTVFPSDLVNNVPNANSIMGIHSFPTADMSQCRKMGAKWFRLHGIGNHYTYWAWVEPSNDNWQWYDSSVNDIISQGYNVLGLLGFGARWAGQVPAWEPNATSGSDVYRIGRYPPIDMNEWTEYVTQTVTHYRDRIKYWEIWNEPDVATFWQGTPQQYAQLLQAAYNAAKAADPNCVIVGGGGACSSTWIEDIFAAGALNYMDAFSMHGYWGDATTPIDAEHYKDRIDMLRSLMDQYGDIVPLWNTEGGLINSSFFDYLGFPFSLPPTARDMTLYQTGSNEIVKRWANILNADVVRDFYYYAGWGTDDPNLSYEVDDSFYKFNEITGAPRPHAAAYGIFSYMVDGAANIPDPTFTNPSVACYAFERDNRLIVTAWAWGNRTVDKALILDSNLTSTDVALYDIMGNQWYGYFIDGKLRLPLYAQPFYIVGRQGYTTSILNRLATANIIDPLASNPTPADDTINVDLNANISWTTGFNAASHDIYFGTNEHSVTNANRTSSEFKANQFTPTYDPGTMSANTKYYWRIDEVVNSEVTLKGHVWSFTTIPNPPTFVSAGAVSHNTVGITPALPSGVQTNDILLLFLETANQAISITNQNGGSWTQVTNSPQGTGTAGGTAATRLTVFWSRYNGTQGAPTTSDSGDHQVGRIIAIRGAVTSGNPANITAGSVESTSDTSGSIPDATTTIDNILVVTAIATSLPDGNYDDNRFSNWTNANLVNLTERIDCSRNSGNGGGLGIATGVKQLAGSYGNTAVTLATSATKGMMSVAIKSY